MGYSPWGHKESDMTERTHALLWFYSICLPNLAGESVCSAEDIRDPGLVPGSGRSPGERNGYPLQCSCLENPTERGAWWATAHGVPENWTGLSN